MNVFSPWWHIVLSLSYNLKKNFLKYVSDSNAVFKSTTCGYFLSCMTWFSGCSHSYWYLNLAGERSSMWSLPTQGSFCAEYETQVQLQVISSGFPRVCFNPHSFGYTEEGVLSVPAARAIPLFKGCLSICCIGILLGETRPEFVF